MAKRRMLDISIIESDRFRLLSPSAQALYLHLNMNADDDGFVGMWRTLLRCLGVRHAHLTTLIEAGYVIMVNDDVLLISDWNLHNSIRRDRYIAGLYTSLLSTVRIHANGRYSKG